MSGCETVGLEDLDHSMKDQSHSHRGNEEAYNTRGGIIDPSGVDAR